MSELDRIRWRSRRGLLELDLVLEKFLDKHLQQLTEQQLDSYKDLLFLPDNDLLDFVDGRRGLPGRPDAGAGGHDA
jgi:antitoxin CptB